MALVRSLRARVVLWVSVALIVLFAFTIVGLDLAFRQSIDQALLEVLEAHVDGLVAAAESGPGGELTMPVGNLDPEFQVANSGMFGAVFDAEGRVIWQSLSLIGRDFPADELPEPGKKHYAKLDVPGFPPLEAPDGRGWGSRNRTAPYTFAIAVSLGRTSDESGFRRGSSRGSAITLTMLVVVGGCHVRAAAAAPLGQVRRSSRRARDDRRLSGRARRSRGPQCADRPSGAGSSATGTRSTTSRTLGAARRYPDVASEVRSRTRLSRCQMTRTLSSNEWISAWYQLRRARARRHRARHRPVAVASSTI
jgi:hypothetical protein